MEGKSSGVEVRSAGVEGRSAESFFFMFTANTKETNLGIFFLLQICYTVKLFKVYFLLSLMQNIVPFCSTRWYEFYLLSMLASIIFFLSHSISDFYQFIKQ